MAFVQGFILRPVLQYLAREGLRSQAQGVSQSYTFVDAMSSFGNFLRARDLTTAYTRAGPTFAGALSQYFVVLSDDWRFHVSVSNSFGPQTGANRGCLGGRHGGLSYNDRVRTGSYRNPIPSGSHFTQNPLELDVKPSGDHSDDESSKRQESVFMESSAPMES